MWSKIWLDRVKELKKERGMSSKQISEKAGISERTVANVLSGDSDAPRIDNICPIIHALGGSLDEIFSTPDMPFESAEVALLKAEIATHLETISQLMAQNELHKEEVNVLNNKINDLSNEKNVNEATIKTLEKENEILRIKIDYESRISSLQNALIEQHHTYKNKEV